MGEEEGRRPIYWYLCTSGQITPDTVARYLLIVLLKLGLGTSTRSVEAGFTCFVMPQPYAISNELIHDRPFPCLLHELSQVRELVDLATIGDQEISNDQILFVVKRTGE